MRTITFSDTLGGRARAKIHEAPYRLNNHIIDRLQTRVSPKFAERVPEVTHEIALRWTKRLLDTLEYTGIQVGDIISLELKGNRVDHISQIFLSITQKTSSQTGSIFARVFSMTPDQKYLTPYSSMRLSESLLTLPTVPTDQRAQHNWKLKSPVLHIGKLQVFSDDIGSVILHRHSSLTEIVNQAKRAYNSVLGNFRAETRVWGHLSEESRYMTIK